MPTNRSRRRRPRHDVLMPEWAERLLAGQRPEPDSEDGRSYFGWLYFQDEIVGLPPADSPEGRQLWINTRADK